MTQEELALVEERVDESDLNRLQAMTDDNNGIVPVDYVFELIHKYNLKTLKAEQDRFQFESTLQITVPMTEEEKESFREAFRKHGRGDITFSPAPPSPSIEPVDALVKQRYCPHFKEACTERKSCDKDNACMFQIPKQGQP